MEYDAGEFPKNIYLETSTHCNAACDFCPSQFLNRADMSLQTAKRIVDQCVGHKIDELHPFQYADPLVWPYLLAFLKYAHKKLPNTRIILYTNAGLLDEDMARALLPYVYSITFSIDGATKEVYEKRRRGLNFETVINNVLHFLELNAMAGHPVHTRAHFTFSQQNDCEREAFYVFWTGKTDEVTFHECDSRAERFGGEKRYYTQASIEPCAQPFNGLFVLSDGLVGMCCIDCRPEVPMGNIHEQSIANIWKGPQLTWVRELHNARRKHEIQLCETCSVRN